VTFDSYRRSRQGKPPRRGGSKDSATQTAQNAPIASSLPNSTNPVEPGNSA
jgi:hypothetical protein